MPGKVPEYLAPTYAMLEGAFPEGVPEEKYLPLLRLLVDHMSQRNLAKVIASFTGRAEGRVLNEVYGVESDLDAQDPRVLEVRELLENQGFSDWLKTD